MSNLVGFATPVIAPNDVLAAVFRTTISPVLGNEARAHEITAHQRMLRRRFHGRDDSIGSIHKEAGADWDGSRDAEHSAFACIEF